MTDRFTISPTKLNGLLVVKRKPLINSRGFFERLLGSDAPEPLSQFQPVQVNRTLTQRIGIVRGMHWQFAPHGDTKLISCLRGEVFDVAVDLRRGSPTFLQWHAEVLSDGNHMAMFIPAGFAHGFQTLSENCEMLYFHSAGFAPGHEGGAHALDPRIAISWPKAISELSARDAGHPFLPKDFPGLDP